MERGGDALKFVVALYRKQAREGRLFFHEHPESASSWGLKEVQELAEDEGVEVAVAGMCMY